MLDVDNANQGVKLAWKTMLPSIELQASFSKGGREDWTDKDWYNYGGFLTFPTVNPVLLRNQVKEAKAAYEQIKYATKAQINQDSFLFLYGGNKLNFNLAFKDQAN